jgi:hypothetical protein
MSAQLIAALRRRADALEDEGLQVAVRGEAQTTGGLSAEQHPRSAPALFFLAAEFRRLADEAERTSP